MNKGPWSGAFLRAITPKKSLTVSEWSDLYAYVATGPEKGRWRTDRTPYLREIMDACADPEVERIAIMASSQVGKTAALLNVVGYYMAHKPTDIGLVFPTVDLVDRVAKRRINPMIDRNPDLVNKIVEVDPRLSKVAQKRRKQSQETVTQKLFPGGSLTMVSAKTSAGLAEQSWQVAIGDEIDRGFDNNEGDGRDQMAQRTATFSGNRKIIYTSTPALKGTSKIEEEYLRGDQRHFEVPCPHCDHFFAWKIQDCKWEKDKENNVITESIGLFCPSCHKKVKGPERPSEAMLRKGRWRPYKPENATYGRSYYLWSIFSVFVPLEEIVQRYVKAMRSNSAKEKRGFYNLIMGLPYEAARRKDNAPTKLYKRRVDYATPIPEGVGVLTMGVDVQGGYLAAELVGWGRNFQSYGIQYKILKGNPNEDKVWEDLYEFMTLPRTTASGHEIKIGCTFVDSGGHHTSKVYEFTYKHEFERVYAVKGANVSNAPLIHRVNKVGVYKNVTLIHLGTSEGKFANYNYFATEDPEAPGFCRWPKQADRGYDRTYFDQLFSEVWKEEVTPQGKARMGWVKTNPRNEPLDCRNYALAAFVYLDADVEGWLDYFKKPLDNVKQTKETL